MVERRLPIFAKTKARSGRYYIRDNFLRAWLSALQRPVSATAFRPLEELIAQADDRLAKPSLWRSRQPFLPRSGRRVFPESLISGHDHLVGEYSNQEKNRHELACEIDSMRELGLASISRICPPAQGDFDTRLHLKND